MLSRRGFLATLLGARVGAMPWLGPAATELVGTNDNVEEPETTAAVLLSDLYRRDSVPLSVCGWVGGIASLQASCSPSSYCAWNTDNGFVGCCDMSDSCTFYTSCVDIHSKAPADDRDDVYTCRGMSECYRNTYPSGYLQWGCGNSGWATTVLTSFVSSDTAKTVTAYYTGSPKEAKSTATTEYSTVTLTAEPSTVVSTVTESSNPTRDSAANASPSEISSTTASSVTGAEASTTTPTPTTVAKSTAKSTPTGAIAGGTVGGIAGIAILTIVMFFLWRNKKRANGQGEKGQGDVFAGADGPVAELESPTQSPAPFHDITAVSSPDNERNSNASVTLGGSASKPVELP